MASFVQPTVRVSLLPPCADRRWCTWGYSLTRYPGVCRRRGAKAHILLRHSRKVFKPKFFFFFVEMFSATHFPIFYKNIFQLKSGQALIFLFFFRLLLPFFFPWWALYFLFQARKTAHKCLDTTQSSGSALCQRIWTTLRLPCWLRMFSRAPALLPCECWHGDCLAVFYRSSITDFLNIHKWEFVLPAPLHLALLSTWNCLQ